MIEVFDKYYKYTTKTNGAGDYMIFGVPTGQQTVHMDVDLSDAGVFSVRPYDFIDNGYGEKLFESRVEFKKSENLNTLPQIKSGDKGVDVIPFWGDDEQCIVGITRVDFDTNFKFEPTSTLIGSIFTDNGKNSLNKRCNPKNDQGHHCELRTGPGLLETIRVSEYKYDDPINPTKIIPLGLEEFVLPQGPASIDESGTFVVTVPCNLDHVITNEVGDLVPSNDPSKGVPTKGMYRFKMQFLEPPAAPKRRTAQIIFPSLNRECGGTSIKTGPTYQPEEQNSTENARWSDNIDVWRKFPAVDSDGDGVDDVVDSFYLDYHEFSFNQIYTISQYIPKYKKGGNRWSFVGLKDTDECSNNLIPFNGIMKGFSILYKLMKPIIQLQAFLMKLITILGNFKLCIALSIRICFDLFGTRCIGPGCVISFSIQPFSFLTSLGTTLTCESGSFGVKEIEYDCGAFPCANDNCAGLSNIDFEMTPQVPCCPCGTASYCEVICTIDDWLCCALLDLAIDRNVIRYTFHDAWLNGSAYLFQYKYKSRIKGNGITKDKFCGPGGDKLGSDNYRKNACRNQRGIYGDYNMCLVRGAESVDIPHSSGEYHQNEYLTGASDIDDMIYCPEYSPMKIINLGRMDACQDTIERIERCITSNECQLDLFTRPGCSSTTTNNLGSCFTSGGYENGVDTEQWVRQLPNSSFQNPEDVIIYYMTNCNAGVDQLFKNCGLFNGQCTECELKDGTWQGIQQVSKIYADVILSESGPDPDPPTVPANLFTPQFTGFDVNGQQSLKFHPSSPLGFQTLGDPSLGYIDINSTESQHHWRNSPYFYFGLDNGRTAMDRLRKEYLTIEKRNKFI
jgi:hypothetical protein